MTFSVSEYFLVLSEYSSINPLNSYDLGEVSNLVVVNGPAGDFNFEPLSGDNNYLGTELVLHSTLSGVEVGLISQWI